MVQPFKIMYTKPPQEVAISNFCGSNIQLPQILKMEPNFADDLYCWCYTLYTAHEDNKTMKEVVAMTPQLQAFAGRDAGFNQFYDRYETVSADTKTRREYAKWVNDTLRAAGEIEAAQDEVRAVYEPLLAKAEQQKAVAEQQKAAAEQKLLASARTMKNEGVPVEIIAKAFPLSKGEIAARYKNKPAQADVTGAFFLLI
jgi:hypothetical protein